MPGLGPGRRSRASGGLACAASLLTASLLASAPAADAACSASDGSGQASNCDTVGQLRSYLLSASLYDKNVRPSEATQGAGAAADEAQVQFYLREVYDVNQKTMIFKASGYFRRWWYDARLAYDNAAFPHVDVAAVSSDVWQPDTYVENSLSFALGDKLLRIYPDGLVWSSERFQLTAGCKMEFQKIPYDTQDCIIEVSTYSQNGNEVVLVPRKADGVDVLASYDPAVPDNPEWEIKIDTEGEALMLDYSGTPWSVVRVPLELERRSLYYALSIIVPGVLFNLMAYMSFWMDRKPAPARVAMGLIPMLITVNSNNAVRNSLPKISYNTWLNDFLFGLLMFNLYVMVSYGVSNFFMVYEAAVANAKTASAKMRAAVAANKPSQPRVSVMDRMRAKAAEAKAAAAQPESPVKLSLSVTEGSGSSTPFSPGAGAAPMPAAPAVPPGAVVVEDVEPTVAAREEEP
eukprot:CAMPEP_0183800358 /NCGR_PEP_ID=MMETSP0803_2-20130417/24631_1 /TAXON_ID=195967 /ORGANISM="Crustomastix stigmata, Strain CCMP3273" /LENGTH=460 /DNA_ID=CAMNT_0026045069 /DNA_START=51 /DNA_END=1430 /DNA_ORIENTATION=-